METTATDAAWIEVTRLNKHVATLRTALEEILALRMTPYCMSESDIERAYKAGAANHIAIKALKDTM